MCEYCDWLYFKFGTEEKDEGKSRKVEASNVAIGATFVYLQTNTCSNCNTISRTAE